MPTPGEPRTIERQDHSAIKPHSAQTDAEPPAILEPRLRRRRPDSVGDEPKRLGSGGQRIKAAIAFRKQWSQRPPVCENMHASQ